MIFAYLELFLLAFLGGILAAHDGWISGGAMLLSSCVLFWLWRDGQRQQRELSGRGSAGLLIRVVLVIGVMFSLGYMRLDFAQQERQIFSQRMEEYGDMVVTLSGMIDSDPLETEQGSSMYMHVGDGSIRVGLPRHPLLWRSQLLTVRGKVKLGWDGVMWTMPMATLVRVEDPSGVIGGVFQARKEVIERMQKLFPGSAGGFLVGVLAGGSRGMSRTVFEDVRATGLTHVIAVSGYNVTIVLGLIIGLFSWLPRKWKALPVGAFLILFVLFVGLSASALRAALMGFLSVYALSAGRKRDLFLALLWSAIFMLLWKPFMLVEDRGFQLSFLATLGVCYVAPITTSWVKMSDFPRLRTFVFEPFFATFAVYLTTLPVLFSFEQFSLIGLVTNIIFVPAIPFFMLLGSVILVLSFLYWPLALFFGYLGTVIIDLYFSLLHQFAILPYANIAVPQMTRYVVIVYYQILCALQYRLSRSSSEVLSGAPGIMPHVMLHPGSHQTPQSPSSFHPRPHRSELP